MISIAINAWTQPTTVMQVSNYICALPCHRLAGNTLKIWNIALKIVSDMYLWPNKVINPWATNWLWDEKDVDYYCPSEYILKHAVFKQLSTIYFSARHQTNEAICPYIRVQLSLVVEITLIIKILFLFSLKGNIFNETQSI